MSVSTETRSEATPGDQVQALVLLPLCIAAFSGLLNVAVLGPFVAVVAADLNVSVPRIGLTATAALATTALSGLAVGWLADAVGFRRVLVAGLGLLAVSGLGVALSFSYALFLLSRVIGSVGFAAANGLPNAIAATRYQGIARQRSLGYISAAAVLAGLTGPPVLTFVGDLTSWRVAFALVGGFAVLSGIGVRLTVPDAAPDDSKRVSIRDGIETYLTLLGDQTVRLIFVTTVLQMASLIGTMVYVGAYLTTETELSVRYVGFAFAAQSIGGLTGSVIAGRIPESRSLHAYQIALGTLALCIFGIYTLPLPVAAIFGLMVVAGLSQVTGWVTLIGILARTTPVGQGSTMVLNGSMLGVGGATGSAVGGAVIGLLGYGALGVMFSGIALASGAFMWLAIGRSRTRTV